MYYIVILLINLCVLRYFYLSMFVFSLCLVHLHLLIVLNLFSATAKNKKQKLLPSMSQNFILLSQNLDLLTQTSEKIT